MQLFELPDELLEEILNHLFSCRLHPDASRTTPCLALHAPNAHATVTRIRLVNRWFNSQLSPSTFRDIICKGQGRHQHLPDLSRSPSLAPLVESLKVDVSPRDFGHEWSEEIHGYPAGDRARYYFDDLKRYLIPPLSRLQHLRNLYLTTTYLGLHLAGVSRGDLLMPCFETLCGIIKEARLPLLEEVQVGVPYEGGYAGFFQDKSSHRVLQSIKSGCVEKDGVRSWDVPGLRKASVRLSDWRDNYTVMEIPAE